ncbi:hypothetical protein PAXRUDRAFT_667655 [Paxillus rubicundulus Ve08.2h10]|uniref:Uncharacterized protein n=1 Tax=Paxillus rubicundulus Ve08.2h10 TaxID=930991 RepID=A0A0D0DJI3_9AGAM|nr:hypothetical protein PAXRUDRAFT_667655 [Paxillus rubicundulus Ve08.2h10]
MDCLTELESTRVPPSSIFGATLSMLCFGLSRTVTTWVLRYAFCYSVWTCHPSMSLGFTPMTINQSFGVWVRHCQRPLLCPTRRKTGASSRYFVFIVSWIVRYFLDAWSLIPVLSCRG